MAHLKQLCYKRRVDFSERS